MLFRGQLMIRHMSYAELGRLLGITRERVRQYAEGKVIPTQACNAMLDVTGLTCEELGIEEYQVGRRPKAVTNWLAKGCPEWRGGRFGREYLTAWELASFLGYRSYQAQYAARWEGMGLRVAGYRTSQRGPIRYFEWRVVREWLVGYLEPEEVPA